MSLPTNGALCPARDPLMVETAAAAMRYHCLNKHVIAYLEATSLQVANNCLQCDTTTTEDTTRAATMAEAVASTGPSPDDTTFTQAR
jgi:hypothetical protein